MKRDPDSVEFNRWTSEKANRFSGIDILVSGAREVLKGVFSGHAIVMRNGLANAANSVSEIIFSQLTTNHGRRDPVSEVAAPELNSTES